MFSSVTALLSITIPIPMAIPESDIVLSVCPVTVRTITAKIDVMGMTVAKRNESLADRKKKKTVIMVTIRPQKAESASCCSEESREKIKARIKKAVEQYNADSPVYKQIQKLYFRDEPFAKTASGKIVRHNMTGGNS